MRFSSFQPPDHPGLLAVAALVLCSVNLAYAGLSGPPSSYVQQTTDGQHLFIMLSTTVPPEEDAGNVCILPNGRKVTLRDEFPASGLYKLGSTKPKWSVGWYEEPGHVVLSANGRCAVRINRFGDGAYGRGGDLSWGLKFYDRGIETNNHDVADLIDYPSLMDFSTTDYHWQWFADFSEAPAGDYFDLRTSTQAAYRFDVRTGEIVTEFRFWRSLARSGGAMVLVLVILGGGWLLLRMRKRIARRKTFENARNLLGAMFL